MPWVDFRLLKPVLDDVEDVIRDGIGRSRRVVRDFRAEEPIEVDETAVRIVPGEDELSGGGEEEGRGRGEGGGYSETVVGGSPVAMLSGNPIP